LEVYLVLCHSLAIQVPTGLKNPELPDPKCGVTARINEHLGAIGVRGISIRDLIGPVYASQPRLSGSCMFLGFNFGAE